MQLGMENKSLTHLNLEGTVVGRDQRRFQVNRALGRVCVCVCREVLFTEPGHCHPSPTPLGNPKPVHNLGELAKSLCSF